MHPDTGAVDPTWCWDQAGTARNAKDAFCGIEEVRASMVAAGDASKGIWLTEFGWSTNTTEYGVSEAAQARYLVEAFEELERYAYVKAAFWYSFRNVWWLGDDTASWEASTGLLRTDFSPKPALAALRDYARRETSTFTTRVVRGARVVRLQGRLARAARGAVAVRVSRRPLAAVRGWRRVATRKVTPSRAGRWSVRLRLAAGADYRVQAVYRDRPVAMTARRRSTPVAQSTAA